MTAKSNKEKKADKLAQDKLKGIKYRNLPLGPSDLAKLDALTTRYGYDDWREMLTRLINIVHGETWPEQLPVPRHTYEPSQKVLRQLYWLGKSEVDPDGDQN